MEKVFDKYKMALNGIKASFKYCDEKNPGNWKNICQGLTKEEIEEKNCYCVDEWCCEKSEMQNIKELVEKIRTLIEEYENGNQE